MTDRVDISVIVPAYQAEKFLAGTLATVASQSRLPRELIVVDDGSTDGTCGVVEAFAARHPELLVRLLREPHRGPGAARNAGVAAAAAPWIAFLDSDDLWHVSKISTVAAAIEAHPQANFLCHDEIVRAVDGSESVTHYERGFSRTVALPEQLYLNNLFSTSTVVCLRELIVKWQGFDEDLSSAQDYELWLKMSPDLVPVFISEPLGTYVLREGNISSGRFWRRLLNIWRVKYRHRHKGGATKCVYTISRVTVSLLAAHVRSRAASALRRVAPSR